MIHTMAMKYSALISKHLIGYISLLQVMECTYSALPLRYNPLCDRVQFVPTLPVFAGQLQIILYAAQPKC